MCLPPLLIFGLDPSDKNLLKRVANHGYFGASILNHYKKSGIALIRKLQSLGLARESKEYSRYGKTEWILTNCGQRAGQLLLEVEKLPLHKDQIISDYKSTSCNKWLSKPKLQRNPDSKLETALRELKTKPLSIEAAENYCSLLLRSGQSLEISLIKTVSSSLQETILSFPASAIYLYGTPLLDLQACIWEPLIEQNLEGVFNFIGTVETDWVDCFIDQVYLHLNGGSIETRGVIGSGLGPRNFLAYFNFYPEDHLPARWELGGVVVTQIQAESHEIDSFVSNSLIMNISNDNFKEIVRENNNYSNKIKLHSLNGLETSQEELETYHPNNKICNKYTRIPPELHIAIDNSDGPVGNYIITSVPKWLIDINQHLVNYEFTKKFKIGNWINHLKSKPGEVADENFIYNMVGALVIFEPNIRKQFKIGYYPVEYYYTIGGVLGGLSYPDDRSSERHSELDIIRFSSDQTIDLKPQPEWTEVKNRWPLPGSLLLSETQEEPIAGAKIEEIRNLGAAIKIIQEDEAYLDLPALVRVDSNVWFLPTNRSNPTKKLQPLLKAIEEQIDVWLMNPPLLSINNWIKGKEGEVYIRYNSKWDRLDLASFNIKEKHQGKGVTKSIIEMSCSKLVKTVRIENILDPEFSKHLKKYKFPNRETIVIPQDLGIVSIDYTLVQTNPIKRKYSDVVLKELISSGKVIIPTETGVTKSGTHWAVWVQPNFVAEIRIVRETFTEVVTWHVEASQTKPNQWKKQYKIPGQLWPPFKNWWADKEFQDLIQS